jgi:hypothetical protein
MIPPDLAARFPKLEADGSKKTSDKDKQYNCIAWSAIRDTKHWWQPIKEEPYDYWPPDVPDDCSFESFIVLFEKLGYQKCEGHHLEPGFEKVALYVSDEPLNPNSTEGGDFTHVASQLPSGAWSSKLGAFEDIEHNSLNALEGNDANEYGRVRQIMKRRLFPT